MTEPKEDDKLPPTMDALDKRLAKLEEKRAQVEGLNQEEINELRKGWKQVKKDEGKPGEAKEEDFLDWLFS